jgi:hypothetical protein
LEQFGTSVPFLPVSTYGRDGVATPDPEVRNISKSSYLLDKLYLTDEKKVAPFIT